VAPGAGKFKMIYRPANGGEPTTMEVYDYKAAGVMMGMYNTDESIRGFAHASFKYAL